MSVVFKKIKGLFDRSAKREKELDQYLAKGRSPSKKYGNFHDAPHSPSPVPEPVARNAELELSSMTMSVLVPQRAPRAGHVASVAFARFLIPGSESQPNLATSYGFETFLEAIEPQINKAFHDRPISVEHGFFSYISSDGMGLPTVDDQITFEVAINTIRYRSSNNEKMVLVFTPEAEEARDAREEQEAIERDLKWEALELNRQWEAEEIDQRDAMTVRSNSFDAKGNDLTSGESIEPQAIGDQSFRDGKDGSQLSPATDSTPLGPDEMQVNVHPGDSAPVIVRPRKGLPKLATKETEQEREFRWKGLWAQSGEGAMFYRGGRGDKESGEARISHTSEREGEDEADIPEVEDEKEDEDIAPEDRAVIKLRALLDMPELTQLHDPDYPEDVLHRWTQCCAMFGIDPSKTGIDERVTIAGLNTKVYQYQAFGILSFGGGFVADDMGLGKTLSFLAYMIVERQLAVLRERVDLSRKEKDGKHLPADDNNRSCPSEKEDGWIACPCSQLNPTATMKPKAGLRMALVPAALIRSWYEQWKTHVDVEEAVLGLNIMVDHVGAFDAQSTLKDQNSRADAPRFKTRAAATRIDKGPDLPKPYQSGYLLLTTKENYSNWAKKFAYQGLIPDGKPKGWKKGPKPGLVFGIGVVDESHEDSFVNRGRCKILADLPVGNEPFFWGYSGTPFSQTPRTIEGIIWAIEKHTRSDHLNGEKFSWQTLDNICKDFFDKKTLLVDNDDAIDKILAVYENFLVRFMLRRDSNTTWFGHPLTALNPHIHQDVVLHNSWEPTYGPEKVAAYEAKFQHEKDALLAKLQEKFDNEPNARRSKIRPTELAFNTLCSESWRSSLLATFPYLIKLASPEEEKPLTLTATEVLGFRGSANWEKDNAYFQKLRQIVEQSPKALWLFDFANSLESKLDVNGDEEKLIVITQFPQFLERYLTNKETRKRIGLVTGRMTLKNKSEVISSFTGKDKGASKMDTKILIGTTRLLGVGLQLTRACHLVLMEPDHHFAREMQAYARVNRIGQKNPFSYSYRLISATSDIEKRVLARQVDRREFPGRKMSKEEAAALSVKTR